jgi:hypothetical protein
MKKLIVVFILLLAAPMLFADTINLGNFPVGQWLDSNYDAVWDFSTGNIRILSTSGAVLWDFSTKTVNNFRVFLDGTNPGISFTCPEAGRSYRFVKPLTNNNVILEIDRDGQPKYSVTMPKQ